VNNPISQLNLYIWKTQQLLNLRVIGMSLYTTPFAISFLAVGLVLGLGMVGAIMLTLYRKPSTDRKQNFNYQLTRREVLSINFKTI